MDMMLFSVVCVCLGIAFRIESEDIVNVSLPFPWLESIDARQARETMSIQRIDFVA